MHVCMYAIPSALLTTCLTDTPFTKKAGSMFPPLVFGGGLGTAPMGTEKVIHI